MTSQACQLLKLTVWHRASRGVGLKPVAAHGGSACRCRAGISSTAAHFASSRSGSTATAWHMRRFPLLMIGLVQGRVLTVPLALTVHPIRRA